MYINEMSVGDQLEGFFLLQDAYAKTTAAGKPFLSMALADCTGTIDAQIWDYPGPVTPRDVGAVVKIRGIRPKQALLRAGRQSTPRHSLIMLT